MITGPLAIARRHVLGDLYPRCNSIETVPVFMSGPENEMIGFADEGLGHYADAFRFHISDIISKRLASGQYTFSFDYEFSDGIETVRGQPRITLTSITLNPRKGYEKPVPRGKAAAVHVTDAPIHETETQMHETDEPTLDLAAK